MGQLTGCALLPHPPIMVPEVGRHEVRKVAKTMAATEKTAQLLLKGEPETIVLITPHGPIFRNGIGISVSPKIAGGLASFGVPEVFLEWDTDLDLIGLLERQGQEKQIHFVPLNGATAKEYRFALEIDHGAIVPLYFFHKAGFRGKLVHLSMGMIPYQEMYELGKLVADVIGKSGKKAAVIASGDLSHRLSLGAPAGFSPHGAEFDQQVVAAVQGPDVQILYDMSPDLIEEAGECGLRPVFFLMGALAGRERKPQVISYEGPFGVGYAVAAFSFVP